MQEMQKGFYAIFNARFHPIVSSLQAWVPMPGGRGAALENHDSGIGPGLQQRSSVNVMVDS